MFFVGNTSEDLQGSVFAAWLRNLIDGLDDAHDNSPEMNQPRYAAFMSTGTKLTSILD